MTGTSDQLLYLAWSENKNTKTETLIDKVQFTSHNTQVCVYRLKWSDKSPSHWVCSGDGVEGSHGLVLVLSIRSCQSVS